MVYGQLLEDYYISTMRKTVLAGIYQVMLSQLLGLCINWPGLSYTPNSDQQYNPSFPVSDNITILHTCIIFLIDRFCPNSISTLSIDRDLAHGGLDPGSFLNNHMPLKT